MKILFSPPDITENEINAVAEAMRSGSQNTSLKTQPLLRIETMYSNKYQKHDC